MIRLVGVLVGVAIGASAIAQSNPIVERKDLMKANGAAARTGTQMVRGEAPFDLAKAQEVFTGIASRMERFPTLFPENSKTGGETRAAPRIWEDMPGFRAAATKISREASEAAQTTTNAATFQANMQKVGANCNACHETYRLNPP